MKFLDIGSTRLISQQIAGTKCKTVKEIVGWMGVMQAQDYAMAEWAISARLPGSAKQEVEKAFD